MECGLAWSVLLSTMIHIITVVKMLWTYEVQPSESTISTSKKMFFSECELKKALCDTLMGAALSRFLSTTAN